MCSEVKCWSLQGLMTTGRRQGISLGFQIPNDTCNSIFSHLQCPDPSWDVRARNHGSCIYQHQCKHCIFVLVDTTNVSHNAFVQLALWKNISFDIDIVVKNESKCGLSWSVLLLTMNTRHYYFPKHCFVLFWHVERVYESFWK